MILNTQKSFTIMELMVVIIIVGAIAAFAIPNYTKTIERSAEQDAIIQLTSIHSANQIYRSRTQGYWPPNNNTYTIATINSSLSLSIIENGLAYSCTGSDGSTFTCTAVRDAPAPAFTVTVTEAAISSTNPSCTAGACP